LLADKDPTYQMTGILPVSKETWHSFRTFLRSLTARWSEPLGVLSTQVGHEVGW